MKMTKKLLAVVLACVMILCVMPMGVFAAEDANGVWVAGTKVSAETETYWLNNDGGLTSKGASEQNYNVKFTPATEEAAAVLTLDGAELTKWYVYGTSGKSEYKIAGIYTDYSELTITLVGKNTITTRTNIDNYYANNCKELSGVYVSGSNSVLTINGKGKLTYTFSPIVTSSIYARLFDAQTINVTEKPKLTLNASGGFVFGGNLVFSGGTIEASGNLFDGSVDLSGCYTEPRIRASEKANGDDSKKIDRNELLNSKNRWVKITERSNFEGFIRNTSADIIDFIAKNIIGAFITWIISQFI